MSFVVVVSPAVKQEMAEAYEWYRSRSVKAASAFRSEVLTAFELLSNDPERWPLWDESIRRFVLKKYPYTVYFSVYIDEVRILAVGHHRRKTGYWITG
ncbi:MAG: type II toxin-antitoxin system RelE/ParE family toxin [Aquabacterium sp.]|nr:type II toxin-antitoxin system RelE/ParE family toxin [Aquabacterium sp.]